MKKISVKLAIAAILMLFAGSQLSAQSINLEETMKLRAAQKAALFGEYLKDIARKHDDAGKSVPLQERLYYCTKALNLFIGKGSSYYENGVERAGVMMETTSVNRATKSRRLIKNYLNGLANLRYSEVKIETTDVANIKVTSSR